MWDGLSMKAPETTMYKECERMAMTRVLFNDTSSSE